jgi:hypothetical protein
MYVYYMCVSRFIVIYLNMDTKNKEPERTLYCIGTEGVEYLDLES